MRNTDDIDLPDAYKRLMAAQRVVSKEERDELDKEEQRESQSTRIRRKLCKVY